MGNSLIKIKKSPLKTCSIMIKPFFLSNMFHFSLVFTNLQHFDSDVAMVVHVPNSAIQNSPQEVWWRTDQNHFPPFFVSLKVFVAHSLQLGGKLLITVQVWTRLTLSPSLFLLIHSTANGIQDQDYWYMQTWSDTIILWFIIILRSKSWSVSDRFHTCQGKPEVLQTVLFFHKTQQQSLEMYSLMNLRFNSMDLNQFYVKFILILVHVTLMSYFQPSWNATMGCLILPYSLWCCIGQYGRLLSFYCQ